MMLFGDILVVAGQFANAVQFIVEEVLLFFSCHAIANYPLIFRHI